MQQVSATRRPDRLQRWRLMPVQSPSPTQRPPIGASRPELASIDYTGAILYQSAILQHQRADGVVASLESCRERACDHISLTIQERLCGNLCSR
jgi:hypothetical protein